VNKLLCFSLFCFCFLLSSYGDKVPRSFLGRLIAIVWTLVGLVIMSFLVAQMTSALVSYSVLQTANKKISGIKVVHFTNIRPFRVNHSLAFKTMPDVMPLSNWDQL